VRLDYEVVIPSRKRSDRLDGWRRLFPFAVLYVHENEHDDYARVVGEANVRTHNVQGLWRIHRTLRETSGREIVVTIDDDVRRVRFIAGDGAAYRPIDDPKHVRAVIENTAIVAKDLNVDVFGWDVQGKPQYFKPTEPFKLTQPCDTAFGTIGRAVLPDPEFWTSGGMDLNLQALVHGRVVWLDSRYYFDNGRVGHGKGGLQGLRTMDTERAATERLRMKWGRHFSRERSKVKGKMGGFTMRLLVDRKNPLASSR
jgi:hypothetical protein